MSAEDVNTTDIHVLKQESSEYVAAPVVISTPEEYAYSAERLKLGKQFVDKVNGSFANIIYKISESLKETKALRDSIINPVLHHRKLLETARLIFEEQQAVERRRIEAEQAAIVAQAASADLEVLSAMGLDDIAASTFMPPPIPMSLPKSQGISTRKGWLAEVTDEEALLRAVYEGRAPRGCLMVNQTVLNSLARASKSTFNIPGVKAVYKTITSVRS